MPPTARNSSRRRRQKADEEVPKPAGESSAQAMAPMRMKLRVRRRDNASAADGEPERSREGSRSSSRRKNAAKNGSTVATASSSVTPPAPTASARAMLAAEEASPDSKCPICLDRFNNLAYLDRCLHRFCFPCIQEWSHNKAECPLCKQPFASILHSVRAENDFKEYTLRPTPPNSSVAATVAMVAAMASAARSDHHMRLMLRRHRVADGGEATTRRRRRERGGRGRGGEERRGVWEWYLGSPLPPLPPLPHHFPASNIIPDDGEDGEDVRGAGDSSERGVIFDGLAGLGGASARPTRSRRASERLMTRLAERLQQQGDGGMVTRMREREMLAFRRMLYQFAIRVRGVPGVTGNQGQQQRDISADSFRRSPSSLTRLRPWLRRELAVLYGAHGSLVDIVQRIIMARLAHHGLEDMATIEEELRPFLLARTEHFVHELVSFARSPLDLDAYDQQAVYQPMAADVDLDRLSTSSDGSSVIAISEGEDGERGGTAARDLTDDITQTGSALSLSGWDDETPGPSYSTAEPSCSLLPTFSPAPQELANEDAGEKEGEDECLIVGYKKPMAERTPELVQLSSDSEEEKEEEQAEVKAPPPLYLPTVPPSTSAAFTEEQGAGEKPVQDGSEQRPRGRSRSGSSERSGKSVCSLSSPSRKQPDGEADGERRRRRKRRRRERDRSGILSNPNRSIYPAMMRRRSPSPFQSSVDSGSPLPPSPADSTWDFRGVQISSLSSSSSSPFHSLSSSPLCSSQPSPPPTPNEHAHHAEKPGGKRKYKSRHLDSHAKDSSWRPSHDYRGERMRKREGGRRKDRRRREVYKENSSLGGESSSRRSRDDRSPSVEIIYEGTISAAQPSSRKRRRRRHRRMQQSSSPVIITLDSDSSHDNTNNTKTNSGSSSPLSSQQTVDFSDLPPLPTVHSAAISANPDADLGDLPADILDHESDGSEAASPGAPRTAGRIHIHSDDSDVDVEKVEDCGLPHDDETGGDDRKVSMATAGGQEHPSDRNLLAAILCDLNQLSASRRDFSLSRDRRGESSPAHQNQNSWLTKSRPKVRYQNKTCSSGSSPPLLELVKDVRNVLPLLRPLQNSPPPLKHKDARSPQQPPVFPKDLHPPSSDPDPVLLGPDKRAIPPIATLKRHFTSSLSLRGELPSTSSTPPSLTAATPRQDFHLPSTESHSSCDQLDPRISSSCTRWSTDGPVFTVSTSGGGEMESPAGHHPPGWGGVFSGTNCNDVIPVPHCPGPGPGHDSGLSRKKILLGKIRSVPTETSGTSSLTHLHPESPGPPPDLYPESPGPPPDPHPECPGPPPDPYPECPGPPPDPYPECPGPPPDPCPECPGPPPDPYPECPGPPPDLLSSIVASGRKESHIPAGEHPNHAALSPTPTVNSRTSHIKGTSGSELGLKPRSDLLRQCQKYCEPGSDPLQPPKLLPDNHITTECKQAETQSGTPAGLDSLKT